MSKDGTVLMQLGEYPFSKRYGWIQDRYGLSWQLIFANESGTKQRVTPVLMFVGDVCGKAEEAINFYASVFPGAESQRLSIWQTEGVPGLVEISQNSTACLITPPRLS